MSILSVSSLLLFHTVNNELWITHQHYYVAGQADVVSLNRMLKYLGAIVPSVLLGPWKLTTSEGNCGLF